MHMPAFFPRGYRFLSRLAMVSIFSLRCLDSSLAIMILPCIGVFKLFPPDADYVMVLMILHILCAVKPMVANPNPCRK